MSRKRQQTPAADTSLEEEAPEPLRKCKNLRFQGKTFSYIKIFFNIYLWQYAEYSRTPIIRHPWGSGGFGSSKRSDNRNRSYLHKTNEILGSVGVSVSDEIKLRCAERRCGCYVSW